MENKHDTQHSDHGHHIVPLRVYFLTLLGLLILTVATVGASYFDFGKANIAVSLGIATAKASLVLLFFMGLKYDNNLNRGVIISSFVALGLLIFFAAADSWTRIKPEPVKVKAAAAALSKDAFAQMETSTPELVARGKEVYNLNCAVCHGAEGKGDGIGGQALNPHPRNFHAGPKEWKNGNSAKAIYVTLAYGIAGSGMASYKALPPEDRWALVHYIHTFAPEIESSSKGDAQFAKAVEEDGIGASGAAVDKTPLPIDFAIDRIAE